MHDELFKMPAIVARYRAGPYVEARERFLRQASAEGYSRSMLDCALCRRLARRSPRAVRGRGGRPTVLEASLTWSRDPAYLLTTVLWPWWWRGREAWS